MIAASAPPVPPNVAPVGDGTCPSAYTCWDLTGDIALQRYVRELRAWVDEVSSACGSVAP